jgi:phosphoglycolate phosphatase-like HAD superfamily hydrolase
VTGVLDAWKDSPTIAAIRAFVADVTDAGGPWYVAPEARVAVFDNDGTLWTEKPVPAQLHFILERWVAMAAADPALADQEPYRSAVSGDLAWLGAAIDKHDAGDDSDLPPILAAILRSNVGHEVESYATEVAAFYARARHPTLGRPFPEVVYRPMVELLRFLDGHGFASYIVSGGGRDFMRPISMAAYGVPPERVIGSALGMTWSDDRAGGEVRYAADGWFIDDGAEKPVRIWSRIGRRPILAAGNSNGDIPMLRYVQAHPRSLSLLIRHDDDSGRGDQPYETGAEQALAAAAERDWTVVSVRDDWAAVFADRGA